MREGDVEWGSVMSGQCAALVDEIRPAADIIKDMADEAEKTLARLMGSVGSVVGS